MKLRVDSLWDVVDKTIPIEIQIGDFRESVISPIGAIGDNGLIVFIEPLLELSLIPFCIEGENKPIFIMMFERSAPMLIAEMHIVLSPIEIGSVRDGSAMV